MSTRFFRLKVDYATSESTSDAFTMDMADDKAFREFADQMLDTQAARTEELATIRNGLSHMGAPEEPKHTLEITGGVAALYHWLRDAKSQPINWNFKMEPRIREYDPMIFKCTHIYNHGSSFEVVLRIDSDSCQFADVVNIYPKDSIPFDIETYNRFLAQFVTDVIKPCAKASNITYRYTGDLRIIQSEPEEPEEEPAFVTRDCLEVTGGAAEFFTWLHGKFFDSEKLGCWSFKAVPGTNAEDFIVCHKVNTVTSPADVHISFRNQHESARVSGIVIMDHYTTDDVGFNVFLQEFVRDILVPYALTHEITYSYSGTPNEHPMKSNGTPGNTITGTLDTLKFTEGVAGFYGLLLTKEHFKDTGNWSVSRCLDNQFKCDFDDLNGGEESFSVYVQFKSDASYGAVTTVGATGNLSAEQYNRHLKRFVDEIVKPYAEIQQLKYEYSGKC